MGNRPSRRQRQVEQVMEMAPVNSTREEHPEYDERTLIEGLTSVSKILKKKKKSHITIVAVGGAVSTILLQSRSSTHDVDFFTGKLNPKALDALRKATEKATRKSQVLRQGWLNNQTTVFLTWETRRMLVQEAIRQNELVFSSPALTVLAAPWGYAFCSKLHRLAGSHDKMKESDLQDAVQYLKKYVDNTKAVRVNVEDVKDLCGNYSISIDWRHESTMNALIEINARYRRKFDVADDVVLIPNVEDVITTIM